MKVWAAICNLLGVFLILFWILISETQYNTFQKDYDTEVLKIATDYASKAALDTSMVNSETLGTDYMSIDNVTITSGKVLSTFNEVMCMCYDIPASDLNRSIVEDAIAGAVICTNDGYFEAIPTDEGLSFVVKKPYSLNLGPSLGVGATVAVRLNTDSGIAIRNGSGGTTSAYSSIEELNGILRTYGSAVINVSDFQNIKNVLLANKINNALTYSSEQISAYRMDRNYRIYIPAYGTAGGINSIDGPTLIVLMRGTDFTGEVSDTSVTMAGYRIVEIEYIIGFEEDGIKYYCYEDKVPSKYVGQTSTFYFKTVYEAAENGYVPHLGYMTE